MGGLSQPWRLLVCGGDGTVSSVCEEVAVLPTNQQPSGIAVWPLGTGNDLARMLGWGHLAALRGTAVTCEAVFREVISAQEMPTDRWHITGPQMNRSWINYCSFGIDARVAAVFDQIRHRHPRWFCAAWVNKLFYIALSIGMFGRGRGMIWSNINSYGGGLYLGDAVEVADRRCHCFEVRHLGSLHYVGSRSLITIANGE